MQYGNLNDFRLSVGTTFDKEIQESVMDITGDDSDMLKNQRTIMKWDQKKKNFVSTGKVSWNFTISLNNIRSMKRKTISF